MNMSLDWLHGTPFNIKEWQISERGDLKEGTPLHEALFFTTDRSFANASGGGGHVNVYRANVQPGARILDLSDPGKTCSIPDSEAFRKLVVGVRPGLCNIQCVYKEYWEQGWRTGQIMKYAPRPDDWEMVDVAKRAVQTEKVDIFAKVIIQEVTRDCIEDIVKAAKEAKYQAIIGNEFQSGVTYPILIVLDPSILTTPDKV
nr:hypothetical protein [uncultured Pseudomonas sp.]